MFKNFFKVAIRNLLNNKLYALINIIGMAVAIAVCITAYLNHTYNYTFDTFHEKAEKIYRVKTVRLINGQELHWGLVPRPLAPALAADFSAIEKSVRLTRGTAAFRYGDKIFNESILHVDPDFFTMFDFPMKYGSSDGLPNKTTLVLSEELAVKYFGDENPVGKQISLRYRDDEIREFIVGAVAAKIPDNSSIQFDVLASLDILVDAKIDRLNDWADWTHVAFVEVTDARSLPDIVNRLDTYIDAHNAVSPESQIARFYFDPIRNLALNSWREDLEADILKRAMHPAGMISPSIIAAMLLLMACFNYINTSIAFSSKRLKEIGVRKVIGGVRRQLIAQFMMENILLCAIAMILGMGLAEIFVPAHDNLWIYFELTLDYTENFGLIAFLGGLLVLVGVGAGAYPAFYVSSYQTVTILRGRQKFGAASWFSRILLTFQFSVSILTIIASLVFIQNADFLRNFDLGYGKDQVVVVPLSARQYQPYRDAIERNSSLVSAAGSEHHIDHRWSTQTVESAQKKTQADIFHVGPDYLQTMKVRFVEGRDFDKNIDTDLESIVVSQKLVRELNWKTPLGQTLSIGGRRYSVIGVIEDIFNNGVWRPASASVFRLVEPEAFRYVTVRVRPTDLLSASDFLRTEWQRILPDVPYEGFFQDEVLAEAVNVSQSIKTMFIYISFLALVIAAMGLFALVSLNIAHRTKEVGIRKVLGASVLNIVSLVNQEFVRLLLAATLVASVAGYFVVQTLLGSIYTYHVGFSLMPFIFAGLSVFLIALGTVGSQVFKVALANPVNALRYE